MAVEIKLRLRLLSVLFVLLVAGLTVPVSADAGGWLFSFPGAGVPYGYGSDPELAMNSSGEAALVFDGDGVRVSLRPAGGGFENPEWGGTLVSGGGGEGATPVEGSEPDVAIDGRRDVIAVWQQDTGPHARIYEATRPAGGSFAAPVAVSAEGEEASEPSVAVDGEGQATVAWLDQDGTSEVVRAATAGLGQAFAAPAGLSGDGADASDTRVVVDPGGDTVVSWERAGAEGSHVEVAVRRAGAAFPADVHGNGETLGETVSATVSEAGSAVAPDVAIDGAGEALAVWEAPGGEVSVARLASNTTSFGPSSVVTSAVGMPSVAIDEAGEAALAWPSGSGVQVATAAAGDAFGSPVTVPARFAPSAVHVAIAATDGVTVEWERAPEGGGAEHEGSFRPAGGSFAQPTGVYASQAAVAGSLTVASDAAGEMVGVWDSAGLNDMESMLYDAGPQLAAIAGPTSGTVGQPVTFSVPSPSSVWRPLRSVTWSFGDGTSASGLSASHVYAAPGDYQVTVTAADEQNAGPPYDPALHPEYVGNSESQTVLVSSTADQASQESPSEALSDLHVAPSSFVAAKHGPSATTAIYRHAPKTGTTVRFVFAHANHVVFSIDRPTAGTLHGKKCLPVGSTATGAHVTKGVRVTRNARAGASVKGCTILHTVGRIARKGTAGPNSFHFAGRVEDATLKPGSYVLLASSVAGRQPVQRVPFRVLAR